MEAIIDDFFADDFNITLLGMLVYFTGLIIVETRGPKTYAWWFKENWLQLVLGLLIVLIMVAKDDEIMSQFNNSGSVWPWWVYLSGGLVVSIVLKIIEHLPKLATKIVDKIFK